MYHNENWMYVINQVPCVLCYVARFADNMKVILQVKLLDRWCAAARFLMTLLSALD